MDMDRYVYINKLHVICTVYFASSISTFGVRLLFAACLFHKALQLALDASLVKYIGRYKSLAMRSPNLQEIYELHLPFSLIIPVLLLLLNARTTLGVARVGIHLEKIIEFNWFVCVCRSNFKSHMVNFVVRIYITIIIPTTWIYNTYCMHISANEKMCVI